MPPAALADLILVIHVAFVAVAVLSVPLIALGGSRGWRWVRRPGFRFTHLAMIAFVACESLIGMPCPLTLWENDMRRAASQQGYENNDFIATWFTRILFHPFPTWVFTVAYVTFALLVASLFYFVPVKAKD